MCKKEWKILCIGNSFSQDTTRLLAPIALGCGLEKIKVVNLLVPGCSISMHWNHAVSDIPVYKYDVDTGNGWERTENCKMGDAIRSDRWDWISIQHGSKDGSRYSDPDSYAHLPELIAYIKENAWEGAKIAFNMTWAGDPDSKHHEMLYYSGDQLLLYEKIARLTETMIVPMADIDRVSPTGTAIQNARTASAESLCRDKYHLSRDTGRYTAGLTFLKALTGADIASAAWMPETMDASRKQLAIRAACSALETPFAITALQADE